MGGVESGTATIDTCGGHCHSILVSVNGWELIAMSSSSITLALSSLVLKGEIKTM